MLKAFQRLYVTPPNYNEFLRLFRIPCTIVLQPPLAMILNW